MNGRRFTLRQRQEIKQLITETEVQCLPNAAAFAYVNDRFPNKISQSTFDHMKSNIRKDTGQKIAHLQTHRYAFLQLFFDRVDELKTLQKEQWRIYHENMGRPMMQHVCLKELHQLTISLGNYYDALPSLTSAYAPSSLTKSQVSTTEGESSPTRTAEIPV